MSPSHPAPAAARGQGAGGRVDARGVGAYGRMDRVIISHIDFTAFDDDRLRRLADTGCVPLMRRHGFSEAILVDNPRRLLTLDKRGEEFPAR